MAQTPTALVVSERCFLHLIPRRRRKRSEDQLNQIEMKAEMKNESKQIETRIKNQMENQKDDDDYVYGEAFFEN